MNKSTTKKSIGELDSDLLNELLNKYSKGLDIKKVSFG